MANLHRGTRDSTDEALAQFYRALQIDRDFASAYAMAAWCHLCRKVNGWLDPNAVGTSLATAQ
jgi:hypothetical protein